jgi:hypothetical protein
LHEPEANFVGFVVSFASLDAICAFDDEIGDDLTSEDL